MTPEELFDNSWNPKNGYGSEWSFCRQGFLRGYSIGTKEATRQAYEDSIQIAELSASEESSGRFRDACFAIADAIRQRIKE